jgi:hypothetical protein
LRRKLLVFRTTASLVIAALLGAILGSSDFGAEEKEIVGMDGVS